MKNNKIKATKQLEDYLAKQVVGVTKQRIMKDLHLPEKKVINALNSLMARKGERTNGIVAKKKLIVYELLTA